MLSSSSRPASPLSLGVHCPGLIFAASLFLCALVSQAQPVPRLNSVSPDWLRRDGTTEVTFNGENLSGITNLIFSGDAGLTASITPPAKPAINVETSQGGISTTEPGDDKKLTASISLTPEASLRPREVRAVGPNGVSNPLILNVSPLPEIGEQEPNNSTNQAQIIELPIVINGRLKDASEVDYYRFAAKKGQHLIFDVYSFRMGSPMDSSLTLLDVGGKEIARNEDYNGLDSLIDFKMPDDGEYLLQLRDFRYQGGGDFKYRLLAGVMPYVTSVYPFGGQRGQNVAVEMKGHNLNGAEKITLNLSAVAPLGPQEIRANTPLGVSNPFLFDVGNTPEFGETEPNNATNQANVVSVPVSINGRLNADKDVDLFKFKSDKDQRLVIQVEARRFGSPLDALLTLMDASGKNLQQNDDSNSADARIDYDQFKKDQEYFLSIKDLLDKGGDKFGYRVTIHQPQPDFSVKCLPDTPRIRRGGRAVLRVELARQNGFNETVRVVFTDLPPGIYSEPLLLSPSMAAAGLMVISAAKDAPSGTLPIKLTATSTIGGKAVTRTVDPLSNDRPVKQAFLTVLDAPPFTIELSTLNVVLEQNQSTAVEVLVQRREGWTGEVKLTAEGFSAGREPASRSLEIQEVTLKGADTRATMNLKAKLDSEIGTRNLVIKGEAASDGQNYTQYSSALPVTITQVPFVLNPTLRRLSVTALPSGSESAASEAVFQVKVERRMGFTNELVVTLDGVPTGVAAFAERIPANGSEATIKLIASERAPAGKEFTVNISGSGVFNDRTYRQKTAPVTLIVAAPATESAPATNVAANAAEPAK